MDEPYVIYLNPAGTESLTVAEGGWAAYHPAVEPAPEDEVTVRVRLGRKAPAGSGQPVEIRELFLTANPFTDLSGQAVRTVPFSRIEAAVNQSRHRDALARRLTADAVTYSAPLPRDSAWSFRPPAQRQRPPRLRLAVPSGFRKPDAFYAAVADLFLHLTAFGDERPAQTLAEANDVEVTTVHRWVKEARTRGLLPATGRNARGDAE